MIGLAFLSGLVGILCFSIIGTWRVPMFLGVLSVFCLFNLG